MSDREVAEIDPWLRVAPALCAGWALAATLARAPDALMWLAAIASLGAIVPWHPFDLPYNAVINRWIGTSRIPRSRTPRRFACGLATVWLLAAALTMRAGAVLLGTALGVTFTMVALVPVVTGLCVPSWLLRQLGYGARSRAIHLPPSR